MAAAELVLVTGGAGFIGSHLCEGLLREGYEVRVLDDLSVGRIENVPAGCEFIHGSVLDESVVKHAVAGVAGVCHEAARVTIRGSVEKFCEDAETNLIGTLRLLKAAGQQGIRRFVYASSMAVYADSEQPVPVAESYPTIPASPYGIAKLAAERYTLMVGRDLGMEPVVLRYFNTFGTRQAYTPYVGVITIFINRLLKKQSMTIFGDGQQRRDFVHVSDVVQANLLALRNSDAPDTIFNIGTGRATSVLELAVLLKQKLYPEAEVRHEPPRAEELRNSIADVTLAERILGYNPKTDLSHQIDEAIDYVARMHGGLQAFKQPKDEGGRMKDE